MKDSFGRKIDYLRLSLTERCTLRCAYCRVDEGYCPKSQELSAEELVLIAEAAVDLGITRIRLTGGEPLLRKDLLQIVSGIASLPGLEDLSMTTNAQMLAEVAADLKEAGLVRLNISMDTLKPDLFKELTGGSLQKVLDGIQAAVEAGFDPLKINVVLMRGVNDTEIDDFIALTAKQKIDVRFIEYMPIGGNNDSSRLRLNNQELIAARPWLKPLAPRLHGQPSSDYTYEGALGRVGFISPISHRFCADCNRIRIMSDGCLRTCLGRDAEISLRDALNKGKDVLKETIRQAVFEKPDRHCFDQEALESRNMSRIGG
ncbi:MAG: GTP 3',8-cyclase MoaA [Anaerolineaceae bacterium]|nr:GTP 3',8-cyclase MoaA [Anaerolineaceae bacterium]MDD4043726.1 GTP 3',8-cyclase MoaA [Anaerolineaceae bacterium]MDD4577659.1 GTP 3',8-cyclase MoaA [Anaerolineaceae bacterium]